MKKHDKLAAFFVAFMGILLYLLFNYSIEYLYGDAMGYFGMSSEFLDQGILNFSLKLDQGSDMQYLFSIRGYAWPLLIAVFRLIGLNTHLGWLVVWSLFLSLGLTYVIPGVFEELLQRKIHFICRVLQVLLTIVFWGGLILYPLSDIPALVISCGGVLLLIKAKKAEKGRQYLYIFFSGILLGFSYYIRTGCIVSVIVTLAIIVLYYGRNLLNKMCILGLLILGVMATMIPQTMINAHCNGKTTWQVPISFNSDIISSTYYMGVSRLRYETNMSGKYPGFILAAEDKMASALLMSDNTPPDEIGAKELGKSILNHPLEYLGIYTAKFANMIDPRFGEVYIKKLYPFRYGILLLNSLIWFLGGCGLFYELSRKEANSAGRFKSRELNHLFYFTRKYFLYIFACIVPGLLHLAGTHVEPRYFYPVYVFLWMYLLAICPWRELIQSLRNRIVTAAISFVVFLGCCCSIWNFTFEQVPYFSYFYQKEPKVYKSGNQQYIPESSWNGKDVQLEIESYHYDEGNLELTAYTYIKGQESKDTKLSVALIDADKEYLFEVNPYAREDVADRKGEEYLFSGICFSNYLWDLDSGEYKVVVILDNKGTKRIADTGKTVTVVK